MLFHIAMKDVKTIFRDKKALAIMLLMPILIMLILGTALGSTFNNDLAIKKFSIGVVNKDNGQMSQILIDDVFKTNMSNMFTTNVVDEDKANNMLEEKSVPAVVIIPENFSRDIQNNKPVILEVKSQLDGQFNANIVRSITEVFAQSTSYSYAGAFAAMDEFQKHNLKLMQGTAGLSAVMSDLQQKLSVGMLKFRELDQQQNRSTITAMQYYAAAMLVMFILFGVNTGTKLLVEERENRTLGRIMSTRASKTALVTGKLLGLLLVGLAQSLILIIFTYFVYRVNWGPSIPGILLVTLCSVFAGAGLGMMVAAIAKTSKAADGIGMVFIQLFTILGGGMIPIYIMPEGMRAAAKFTLNWWAFQSYNGLMLGDSILSILPYCGILVAMGVGYLSLGILRFKVE